MNRIRRLSLFATASGVDGPLWIPVSLGVETSVYGKEPPDPTPDAINWLDVSYPISTPPLNNVGQITGINSTITLSLSWTGSLGTVYRKVSESSFSTGDYALNSADWVSTLTGGTFAVPPNYYVGFLRIQAKVGTGVFTVRNVSDLNTVLDTFSLAIT